MPLSPRLLRPKASGTAVPQFATKGHTRLWCVTTKSSESVTGTVESDSGHYTVLWWDNTTTTYADGDTFSKAAAGNQRAFEIYPSDSSGNPSGQFDRFNVSGNALTQVRAELVMVSGVDPGVSYPGGWTGGFWTYTYYGLPQYIWGNYNPPSYVSGTVHSGSLHNNSLSSAALDQFYTDLENGTGHLFVQGNPGIDADDPTIATAKGYTVFGSEPE